MNDKKPVIVTGGAGFIGSHLVKALLQRGESVIVIDDFSSGQTRIPEAQYHDLDISDDTNETAIADLIRNAGFVFHLAAQVGVKNCYEHPEQSFKTNVLGAHRVLRLCKEFGVHMLEVSSSSAYGKGTGAAQGETTDIIFGDLGNGSWHYGLHKAVAEAEARNAGMVAVRIFNTTGIGQRGDYGFVVPTFVKQAVKGKPLTVFGDGTQTRSFCDVRNTVEGLLLLRDKGIGGEMYNLGSEQEFEIKKLAELVITTLHSSSEITYVPREKAIGGAYEEIMRRLPDLQKIRSLGYQTTHTLPETIRWIAKEQYGWNETT